MLSIISNLVRPSLMWFERFNLSIAMNEVEKSVSLAFSLELLEEEGMTHLSEVSGKLRVLSQRFRFLPEGQCEREGDFTFAEGSDYLVLPMDLFPEVKPQENSDLSIFLESHGYALVCRDTGNDDIQEADDYFPELCMDITHGDRYEHYSHPVMFSVNGMKKNITVHGIYDFVTLLIGDNKALVNDEECVDIYFSNKVECLALSLKPDTLSLVRFRIFGNIERIRYGKGTCQEAISEDFDDLYPDDDTPDRFYLSKYNNLPREVDLTALDDEEVESSLSTFKDYYRSVDGALCGMKEDLTVRFFMLKNEGKYRFDRELADLKFYGRDSIALKAMSRVIALLQDSKDEAEKYSKSLEAYQLSPASIEEVKFILPRSLTREVIEERIRVKEEEEVEFEQRHEAYLGVSAGGFRMPGGVPKPRFVFQMSSNSNP
jgi:hypothetical protein